MDVVHSQNELQQIDIRTVSAESLRDINEVIIDTNLPVERRVEDFVRQIGNPYYFRCGKLIVQVEHRETGKTINDCLQEYLEHQIN